MPEPHPLEDPGMRATLEDSVAPSSLMVFAGLLGAVTLVGQLLADGDGLLPAPGPAAIFVVMLVAVWRYRAAVLAGDTRGFDLAQGPLAVLQVLWVAAVSWEMPADWELAAAGVMGSFLVAWAFLDAQQYRGSGHVRNLNLLGFASVPCYLFALDLVGHDGLYDRMQTRPEHTGQWIFVLLLLAAITTAILTVVGSHVRDAAERQAAAERILRERTALATERQSLQLVARMLHGNVAAGRLRHDIASPLTVIAATVEWLNEVTPVDPETREALLDLQDATKSMATLITALPAPTEGPQATQTTIETLITEVEASFRSTLAGHGIHDASVKTDLEPSAVWAGPEHVLSLASLLVNGRMQQSTPELLVTGAPACDWYYRLEIRDFGVSTDRQVEALERVRAGLRLQAERRREGAYRGLGLGLPLCKLQLASHGAWIDATLPEKGPGLVLQLSIPRVRPDLIPERHRTPEIWLDEPTLDRPQPRVAEA